MPVKRQKTTAASNNGSFAPNRSAEAGQLELEDTAGPQTIEQADLVEVTTPDRMVSAFRRQPGGLWVDVDGTECSDEQLAGLGQVSVVARDVDNAADGFEGLGNSSSLGDTSLGQEYSNRKTWQLPDGTYVVAEATFGATARPSSSGEWEGEQYDSAFDLDWDAHQRMTAQRDELERQYDLATDNDDAEDLRYRLDQFPDLQYDVASELSFTHCTDCEDPGNTELRSCDGEPRTNPLAFATLAEAETDAMERAQQEFDGTWHMPSEAFAR